MPYRSQFITATDDPLLHPPTRNAANPPTPCNTASCPATTQRHTNHTTARARHTPPVNQKPRSRSCPSCAHPPDLLPHRSHFITPPLLLTRRVDCSHCPRHPASRTTTPCRLHSSCALSLLPRGKPPNPPPTSSPLLPSPRALTPAPCASWPATAQHQPATPTTARARRLHPQTRPLP